MRMMTWLAAAAIVTVLPATVAALPGDDASQGVATVADLRQRMAAERDEAERAAAAVSYRAAVEHYQQVRQLLGMERRILEEQISVRPADAADARRALESNRTEDADVAATLSLLRVALAGRR
jgi:small-conductance mechanosensitive channel